jgi:O-antigen/teichoic acid export membrane protein
VTIQQAWSLLRNRALGSTFWRAVGMVAGGAAFAQSLSLLAAPILTRVYAPAEYGIFALYLSILFVLLVVCTLCYHLAIPLPEDDAAAAQLLVLALVVVLGMSTLFGIAVVLGAGHALTGTPASALAPYLWLGPIALFAGGFYQSLNYWAMRHKAFAAIAKTRIIQGVGRTSTQVALGAFCAGPIGLILGDVVGRTSSGGMLAGMIARNSWSALAAVRPAGVRRVAVRYRRFAALSTGSALLDTGTMHLPALLLSVSFALQVVGWFSLAQQAIFLPLGLIAHAVSQVYAGHAPRAAREGPARLRRLFLRASLGLALIGAIPALALALLGPSLFALVFGTEWTQAGGFASLMAPILFFTLVVSPLGYTLNALERPDILLVWNGVQFTAVLGALVGVPALGGTPIEAVAAYSASLTVAYVALFVVCLWQIQIRLRKVAAQRLQNPPNLSRGPVD